MSPTALVAPPVTRRCTFVPVPGRLVIAAAFPTTAHLFEACLGGVLLATGLLLLVLASLAARGQLAAGGMALPITLVSATAALALIFQSLRRLAAVRPYRIELERDAITVDAPPGAPRSAAELDSGQRLSGGRRTVAWTALGRIEVRAEGLAIAATPASLLVPWRYRKRAGSRLGSFDFSFPAFRYEELDWIAALCERLRSGDPGALSDLNGSRDPLAPPPSEPLWEDPVFVVAGVSPARLRLLVALPAAAVALWFLG